MNKHIKRGIQFTFTLLLLYSCGEQSELSKEFKCSEVSLGELEMTSDFQDRFSLPIPTHWKTNLYFDNTQSSIYFADTTKQLTETVILDATFYKQKIDFKTSVLPQIQTNYVNSGLLEASNREFTLQEHPSYFSIAKGKRRDFTYTICNVFMNTTGDKFMHVKIEVYGDSLVNERLCKGINLIEKIEIK